MGNKLTGPVLNQKNDLLQLSNSGNGILSTELTVCDGSGTSTALGISTTAVYGGNIKLTGHTITSDDGAAITIAPDVTFSGSVTGIVLPNPTSIGTHSVTLAGNFSTSGAYAVTLTVTGITNVTLPNTGTLATLAGTETFTNKTLTSPTITAPTIASISPDGTNTLTLPTATDTLVGKATTDTLTNKTLTSPIIASIKTNGGANTVTFPTSTDTLVGLATTDTLTNKTLTSPVLNTGVSGTALAAKSDQITGTATGLLVTPSIQQNHASAAKFWVQFSGSTGTITTSYNVTSVNRNGTGNYTINFTTAFSTSNYAVIGTALNGAGVAIVSLNSRATTSCTIYCLNSSGAGGDPTEMMVVGYGTQ